MIRGEFKAGFKKERKKKKEKPSRSETPRRGGPPNQPTIARVTIGGRDALGRRGGEENTIRWFFENR